MEEFKMTRKEIAQKLLQEGEGILRLTPTWVPRSFCRPGRRIKLHPDDYYALGLSRGGIDERWFASTFTTEILTFFFQKMSSFSCNTTHICCKLL